MFLIEHSGTNCGSVSNSKFSSNIWLQPWKLISLTLPPLDVPHFPSAVWIVSPGPLHFPKVQCMSCTEKGKVCRWRSYVWKKQITIITKVSAILNKIDNQIKKNIRFLPRGTKYTVQYSAVRASTPESFLNFRIVLYKNDIVAFPLNRKTLKRERLKTPCFSVQEPGNNPAPITQLDRCC